MNRTVILIHGILSDGRQDVDKLRRHFEKAGYEAIPFYYGFRDFVLASLKNDGEARKLADIAPEGSLVVGHSNAAVVVWIASNKYGAKFTEAVLISPALDNKARFGPNLKRVAVLYSKYDVPIWIAQYIPFSPYGNLGAVGYKGKDLRVESYDKMSDFEMKSWSHFADLFFDERKVAYFAEWIMNWREKLYEV